MNVRNPITFKDIDIFSPYILVLAILIYLVLAGVAYQYHIRNLQYISLTTFLFVIYGTILYILGVISPLILWRYRERFPIIKKIKYVTNPGKKGKVRWTSRLKFFLDEKILLGAVLIGLILQFISLILVGGLPLFSGVLKFRATNDLWRLSYPIFLLAINLLLAQYYKKSYLSLFLIGLILFAATGYRTTTIAIMLSVFITIYYTRKVRYTQVFLFFLILFIIGVLIGYVAVKAIEWQVWTLNPLELLFYRAGFTLMVLDKIVSMQGATGGFLFQQIFSSGHPRVTVGCVALGYNACITSTIFGPALLDFGSIGLAVQMFLIGLILRLSYEIQKLKLGIYSALYAIIISHTLIWIETGPTDIVVWFFYALNLLAMFIFAKNHLEIQRPNIPINTKS